MRDLTENEMAKCPKGCDYYHIINNQVLFTNALGIGVFDIHGNKVDDSILDGVFQKSRPIERPFDITQHEWSDSDVSDVYISDFDLIGIGIMSSDGDQVVDFGVRKQDAIAIAKHFNLTAEDLRV